ncbi:MBL fold metallo-hydrolase [Halospeciosus flavus]|uniref:MBL fold metallo-hydrolase n=1 Tax=Halospeciosus flavus TaxID=3032283 RepID=A0ABD5Z5M3_9EURY|nr:MBL fold metallo-hydrolase [Halospeciosus flavus]
MIRRHAFDVDLRVPSGATNGYRVDSLLVDPAGSAQDIVDSVNTVEVSDIVLTHTHADHAGGVATAAERTDATVWSHARHVDAFETTTGVEPDRTFRAGDTVGPATVVETPGHARDHVALRVDDDYLSGDLVFGADVGSTFVGGEGADMRAYVTSLRRLYARDPDTLYPGHGPPIEDPRGRIADLLAHRRERERSIERAVGEGARTVDEILDAVYEKDLGDFRRLAALTIEAHLDKLAVEGRVAWDGERADPT